MTQTPIHTFCILHFAFLCFNHDIPCENSDLTFSAGLCWQVNMHIEQPPDILSKPKTSPKSGKMRKSKRDKAPQVKVLHLQQNFPLTFPRHTCNKKCTIRNLTVSRCAVLSLEHVKLTKFLLIKHLNVSGKGSKWIQICFRIGFDIALKYYLSAPWSGSF